MIKDAFQKLIIDNDNQHLLDLYYLNSVYLELGSINYDVIRRILNYELTAYEDITYFPLQNNGLGRSEVNNDDLKNVLPFFFFERLNQKNKNNQIFITYGLLQHKDENNREIFSPLILIPINIYFENEKIFIQQISRPVENTYLINYLSKVKKVEIPPVEKLDTVYALDKYCLSFEKYEEASLKLENYMTFALIKESEMKLDRNLFTGDTPYPDYLIDCLYNEELALYYSLPLSRKQRQALYKGTAGDNFVLTGRLGTGKTTTLFNIAFNAISVGKRVLYVSNMKETLGQIYQLFESKGLGDYLTDFTNSFASFHQGELIISTEAKSEEINPEPLFQNYRLVKKYVDSMTARILDFRFIDLVNQLASISDLPKEKLDIDDLSGIYKNEYLEIYAALVEIEKHSKAIGNVKDNIWKEIPLLNNIKYPNQIFSLIHQVEKNYLIFEEEKEILEDELGLKPIANYAYLKSVFHDIYGLDIKAFPLSWVKKEVFDQAQEEFRNLKSYIYQIQEMEYLLDSQFENLETINIEKEYKLLLGPYFGENDLGKIDHLLENQKELEVIVNKIAVQLKIYSDTVGKIASLMNWEFPQTDFIINEILNLNQILQTQEFSSEFIRIITSGKYEETVKQIAMLSQEIKNSESEIVSLFKNDDFGQTKDLEQDIESFEKYTNDQPVKRSTYRLFSNIQKDDPKHFQKLQQKIKTFREMKNNVFDKRLQFKNLTGFECEERVLENLKNFYDYYLGIDDALIKSKVIKFLKSAANIKAGDSRLKRNYRNIFDLFSKSYYYINAYYLELVEYGFSEIEAGLSEKIQEIQTINKYLQNLYRSNQRLKEVEKSSDRAYVSSETYINLLKSVRGISEKKKELKEKDLYRYLYGKLYEEYDTNINNISRFLQAFKVYSDCFSSNDKLIDSLNEEKNHKLIKHLKICEQASDNLTEIFKLYFKVFRDSVSKYYYTDFKSILEFLSQLIDSKEELIGYLGVTENLKILKQYRLHKLIDLVLKIEDPNNLSLNFKYTYLDTVKEIYLDKHPYLVDFQLMENTLNSIMNFEADLIKAIEKQMIYKIKNNSSNKFSVYGIKNLDYSAYIRRTSSVKHLLLTNTQILNNYIDLEEFDLVIIDDAHLLSANDYYRALQGRQVVVAGEEQLLSSVANNLISRVDNQRRVNLDYRYTATPKNLMVQMSGLSGRTYSDYYDNFGIEIINEKILEYISLIFKENREAKINIFNSSLTKQKHIYETLANLFLSQGYKAGEIINIFKDKLNLADLNAGYLFNADYNIIYLEDYYDLDLEYVVVNFIDELLLCQKKLIIYDNKDILNSQENSHFLSELRRIINHKTIYLPKEAIEPMEQLVNKLKEAGIIVYASTVFSLLLRKEEKLYGVLLFWDKENADYLILNEYRENYLSNHKAIKIFIVWSVQLMESVNKVAETILDGLKDE